MILPLMKQQDILIIQLSCLNVKIVKKQAQKFDKKILEGYQKNRLMKWLMRLKRRTIDSRFHMRLDKQEW